jgi:hypothetical protein
MKKKILFLMLALTCVYSIASAGTIDGSVFGDVQAGVSIRLETASCGGTSSESVITDGYGDFRFNSVSNGDYTVKSEKTGYAFSPGVQSVTINNNYMPGVDFTATVEAVGRFIDNGDGTVTDTITDLIWLKDANCFGTATPYRAGINAEELNSGECGLTDGSVEGDWRLSSKEELQGIGTDPQTTWESATPTVQWTMPDIPFDNVQPRFYWSSTRVSDTGQMGWFVSMGTGNSVKYYVNYYYFQWPVRDNN